MGRGGRWGMVRSAKGATNKKRLRNAALTGQKYLKSLLFSIITDYKVGLFLERKCNQTVTDTIISISNSYSTHSNYTGSKPSITISILTNPS